MRINVHDYSGHPFQVQLSRELAWRGHEVEHTYCSQYVTGRGRLEVSKDDPQTLKITPLHTPVALNKYSPVARTRFELAYAAEWTKFLRTRTFDQIVSCNVPLFTLARMQRHFRSTCQPWVFWHQDIYSHAINDEFRRRAPRLSRLLSGYIERLEMAQVRNASETIAISEAFRAQYARWGLQSSPVTVIPNWAPLEDLHPVARDNDWARSVELPDEGLRLMYSGTLGRKHNPLLLVDLLNRVQAKGIPAVLVVCSEGVGADVVARATRGREDVYILGFQPAEQFDQVLSSADVVVALLEPNASEFSVPSKVLSYLSAGRAVVGLMPSGNPAALDINGAGGFVGTPDHVGVGGAASWIAAQGEHGDLAQLGAQARAFAEQRFDIEVIANEFEKVFSAATARRGRD